MREVRVARKAVTGYCKVQASGDGWAEGAEAGVLETYMDSGFRVEVGRAKWPFP